MRSKKLLICLVFLFVSLFAFNFNVKASTYLTSELITVEGAQVRTTGNAGLRFVANETYEGETSYGIILAYGEAEANENFVVGGTVNGKAVGNAPVATAEEGVFKVTLWNIPESEYETKISARAYVVAGGEYVYSSTVTVRSLADVVKYAYEAGNRTEFVVNVYNQVTYETVELSAADEAVITKYNPTKFVLSNATTGNYKINGTKYAYGTAVFATISSAVSAASENDVIYVFDGSYAENITISKALTILGPNADKAGSANNRVEEAALSGTITLSTNSITLNGLKFEKNAKLTSSTVRSNIKIKNNYFSSTLTDANLILFNRTSGYYEGLEISSNYFEQAEGVTTGATSFLYFSDINDFTFTNNTFVNIHCQRALYVHDNARGLSGSGNSNLSNNSFTNIAGTAMHINYYCPTTSTTTAVFDFNNNTFNNVGTGIYLHDTNSTAVIAEFNMTGNEFTDTNLCVRINGLPGTGTTSGIKSMNVTGNIFNTIPSEAYFNFKLTGTYGSKYTGVYDVTDNIYPGNVTSDQSSKFVNVEMTYYVSQDITTVELSAADETVITKYNPTKFVLPSATTAKYSINGSEYEYGTDVFLSLSEAVSAASANDVIYVFAGTYATALAVDKALTILGPNADVEKANRVNEVLITAKITVSAGVSGFTLNGVELSGAGCINLAGNASNITMEYCKVGTHTQDGVLRSEGTSNVVNNVKVNYNFSDAYKSNRFVYFSGTVNGLEMIRNDITCTTCYDFLNVGTSASTGLLKGTVVIEDNKYVNSLQSFIYVRRVGILTCTIEGNYVENMANTIVDLRNMIEDGAVVVNINNNEFVDSGAGWMPIRVRNSGYDANDTLAVYVNDNKFIDSYCEGDVPEFIENPGSGAIYTIGRNYYEISGQAYTTLTAANFCDAAISFGEAYASASEIGAAE